jgi:hypothetical protein
MLRILTRQWRSSGQRGSVLSALLIIIAFLAILAGALFNEISGQFLLTQTLSNRIAAEATVNASVESSIAQLQSRTANQRVPSRCATDNGAEVDSSVTLNGNTANTRVISCIAIIPDQIASLAPGTFSIDGTHVTLMSFRRNTYLVGNSAGWLFNYKFGQTDPMWKLGLGSISGQPSQEPDSGRPGHFITAVPIGAGVALVDDFGSGASPVCTMAASGTVTSQPAFENPPSGSPALFPDYVFFGDQSGDLYAFSGSTAGSCTKLASVSGLGGPVIGGPLVLSGEQTSESPCGGSRDEDGGSSRTAELYAVVNNNGTARLVHYEYCESTVNRQGGGVNRNLNPINDSKSLSVQTPKGVAYSSNTPSTQTPIRLVVTGQTGQVAMTTIRASSSDGGLTYSIGNVSTRSGFGGFANPPYWCHCPEGDRIGAGSTTGTLYVFDTGLNVQQSYDGRSPITTAPAADANGDWYFGADNGNVYEVEPQLSGKMFPAGTFGLGAPVQSSPVVGNCLIPVPGQGTLNRICLYAGATNNSDFVQIGDIRVMNLQSQLTAGSGPPLWARVEVGNSYYVGGQGVHILSWSYFNP